ncbi:helix-hairpin-helix domain-containing protein [Thermospira aquatica]|uniref:PHP domain-containing protein n=1 Tax=Thermospira aquatica TaxID=2828656 RepID=A0AAX3BEH4_9SPIR|nr:PHP domain-containing protein [Thermospira aquatica]URA10518.1 PHP domain-containing protein [Thermospira aquatica]
MLWTHLVLSFESRPSYGTLSQIASLYREWGWEAICLCERYSTRHFASLGLVARNYQLKPIYGVEILTHALGTTRAFPALLLARDEKGLQNLYELVGWVCRNKKRVVPPRVLEEYREGLFLLVGEELEEDDDHVEKSIHYYENVWGKNWWVVCQYTEEKPIEKIRRLVSVISAFSLRGVASVPQKWGEDLLWSYEDVASLFHNHLDFVEAVTDLLSSMKKMMPFPGMSFEKETYVQKSVCGEKWLTQLTQRVIGKLLWYREPFLVKSVPVDIRQWFCHIQRKKKKIQPFLFEIRRGRFILAFSSQTSGRLRSWLAKRYEGHIGCVSFRGGEYNFLVTSFPVKEGFSLVGEADGIPLIQTTRDALFFEGVVFLRFESHWLWDILCQLYAMGKPPEWHFPLVLRWLDHPLLLELGVSFRRRHVFHHFGEVLRFFSRGMKPFLKGPFLYQEDAVMYLSRFVSLDEARNFMTSLRKEDDKWVEQKRALEASLPEEEKHSRYWHAILEEGRYLLPRREEWLRWYPLALFVLGLQEDFAAFTVACLNQFHHVHQQNRILLYARLVWDVEILPVCVNHSDLEDKLEDGKVRLGFRHLTSIPFHIREEIVRAQPYRDLFDFLAKHPHLGKKSLQEWIRLGLLDDLQPDNGYKLVIVEGERKSRGDSLFDEASLWEANKHYYTPVEYLPLSFADVTGLYAFEHPLDRYAEKLLSFRRYRLRESENVRFGVYVAVPVGIHGGRNGVWYELVDESGWRQVFFQGSPPFSPELYRPYIWRIVLNNERLEVVDFFVFDVQD